MPQAGTVLNLAICSLIVALNLYFGIPFCRACRKLADDRPKEAWWLVVIQAQKFWTLSWVSWLVLYAVRFVQEIRGSSGSTLETLLLALSDVNSIFTLLVAWGILKGNSIDQPVYKRISVIAFFVLVALEVFVISASCLVSQGKTPELFLRLSSLCLAVFATMQLGEAFWLRYRAASVYVLAGAYALAQPFAYGAALYTDRDGAITFMSAASPPVPKHLSHFVQCAELPKGEFQCTVHRKRDEEKLPLRLYPDVLRVASSGAASWWVYLRLVARLHLDNMVFAVLAAMKLALSASVLTNFRVRPSNLGSLADGLPKPTGGSSVVTPMEWKVAYWIHIFAIPLALLVAFLYFGPAVGAVLLSVAGVLSALLVLTKGGRTLVAMVRRRPPDDDNMIGGLGV